MKQIAFLVLFLISPFFAETCFAQNEPSVPDKLNFVLTSSRSGKQEIWKRENGVYTQLTKDKKKESWRPKISPDGKKILFYRSPSGSFSNTTEKASLWMMNLDGSEQTQLISQGENGWIEQSGANWSHDGQKIIMAVAMEKNGPLSIIVTDNKGKNPQKLIKRAGYFADPSYSPDGQRIAYVAWPEDYIGTSLGHLEVFVMKADGTEETRLTYDEFRDHDPAWSFDGKKLVFETATRPGNIIVGKWGIRTISIAADEPKNVLFNDSVNLMAQWLPNGEKLIFQQVAYLKNRAQLFLINDDGTNQVPVTDGKYDDKEVDLLP